MTDVRPAMADVGSKRLFHQVDQSDEVSGQEAKDGGPTGAQSQREKSEASANHRKNAMAAKRFIMKLNKQLMMMN